MKPGLLLATSTSYLMSVKFRFDLLVVFHLERLVFFTRGEHRLQDLVLPGK